jgi:hypothetical protein
MHCPKCSAKVPDPPAATGLTTIVLACKSKDTSKPNGVHTFAPSSNMAPTALRCNCATRVAGIPGKSRSQTTARARHAVRAARARSESPSPSKKGSCRFDRLAL